MTGSLLGICKELTPILLRQEPVFINNRASGIESLGNSHNTDEMTDQQDSYKPLANTHKCLRNEWFEVDRSFVIATLC